MDAYNTHDAGADSAHTYDVGRIHARRFAGVRITGALVLRVAMGAALMLSLFAQLGHTAHVANYLSRGTDGQAEFNSYVFAVAVEFSVLLLVLAGHRRLSWLFAAATFATNLAYYWIVWGGDWQSANTVFAVLMSLLLPAVIVAYSHSVVAHDDAVAHADDADDADGTHVRTHDAGDAHTQAHAHTQAAQTYAGAEVAQSAEAHHTAHESADVRTQAHTDGVRMTREQRLRHIEESGVLDPVVVAAQYGIQLRTAQKDIADVRAGMTHVNGTAVHA